MERWRRFTWFTSLTRFRSRCWWSSTRRAGGVVDPACGHGAGVEHWQSVTGSKDHWDEPWEATAAREVQEETGIDVQAPGCRLTDWGWRTITTSGPSGATAMRLTCRATASGCLACASLLRCPWCSIHANTCAFSGCLGSMLPTCVFLPPMPKPAYGCRVCRWWMEANFSGYTPAIPGRNRGVSWGADEVCRGICRVGWRLFAVCACGLHCACAPARKRCWAAMSLSAERARVRMTTPPGCRSLSCPRTALVGLRRSVHAARQFPAEGRLILQCGRGGAAALAATSPPASCSAFVRHGGASCARRRLRRPRGCARHGFSAVLLISSRHSRMDSEYGGKMLHALAISSHSPRVLA